MIVANFTPDDLEWTHIGVTGTIKSGQILEMEDNRARHVLNKLEARGLLRMQFGDDPGEKQQVALGIYKGFWVKQITGFNNDQDRRKDTHRDPIYPHEQLMNKAKELGVEILGPWAYKPSETTELGQMRKENSELRGQVAMLMEKMNDFMKATGTKDTPVAMKPIEERVQMAAKKQVFEAKVEMPPVTEDPLGLATPLPEELDKLWKTVDKMKKDKFVEWIMENAAILNDPKTPPALVKRLEMKWKQAVPSTDWPLPK
jgi:hypothetical protein